MSFDSDNGAPRPGSGAAPSHVGLDHHANANNRWPGARPVSARPFPLYYTLYHCIFDAQNWQLRLARLLERAGRPAAAETGYRKVLARRPKNPDALAGLGRLLLRARQFDEAVTIWRQATEIDPQASAAAFQLARALHRRGQIEEAAEQYLRVLTLDPSHDKAFAALEQLSNRLARGVRTAGEASAAARIGERLLSLRPGSPEARRGTERIAETIVAGALTLVTRVPDIALEQFNAALTLAPNLASAMRGAADCQERLGRFDDALAQWQKLAQANPEAIEPWLHQQRLLVLLGRIPKRETTRLEEERTAALEAGGSAAVLDPELREAALARARGLMAAEAIETLLLRQARSAYSGGRLGEAEALYQSILALDPLNRGALSLLSRIYMRQERWADTAAAATRLCALEPNAPEPRETLARALLQGGELEGAAAAYQELHRLQPENRETLEALGRLYTRLHNWQAACQVLARLVELDPSQTPSRVAYGRALQQAGQCRRSRKAAADRARSEPPRTRRLDTAGAAVDEILSRTRLRVLVSARRNQAGGGGAPAADGSAPDAPTARRRSKAILRSGARA